MIKASLIDHIFKAASISRWNDYPKTVNLVELDKQAHKFIIAYFIAKYEKDINMKRLIECGIFEFLLRVSVTDIRPDVFHQMQKTRRNEINEWVISQLENEIKDIGEGEFFANFKEYLQNKDYAKKERFILKAASYLATKWEFNIIYENSKFLSDINDIKNQVDEELEDYFELIGVSKIAMNKKIAKIIDLSGRLRFQKRWAQTPRIPETAVLGHMLVVAVFAYFYLIKVGAGDKRLEFSFYCALFHDLPESLTRDIISPVKYGINGLEEIISEYEMRLIDEKILPFIPENINDEFGYILGIRKNGAKDYKNEFENRIYDSSIKACEGTMCAYNDDKFRAIDGKALKYCDKLAAYVEAGLSISYGVKSKELIDGFAGMHEYFKENPKIEGVDFYKICEDFEKYFEIKNPFQDGCGTHQ